MNQSKKKMKRKTSIQIMISLLTTRNTQQFRFEIFLDTARNLVTIV